MDSPIEGTWNKKQIFSNKRVLLGAAAVLGVVGVVLFIVGIVYVIPKNYITIEGYDIVKDYTDCLDIGNTKCKDFKPVKPDEECSCYIPISITEPMKAPVTVFYELESYDQIISNYSQSRDDNQLAGHLSPTPSNSCGQYTYVNTTEGRKPIAPCGGLANAMFTDMFSIQTNNTYMKNIRTGLISGDDKKPFHNPKGNLSEALKNFSKPIDWKDNVWELDTKNPDNNGFQNEAFIIWMKTDLKRKPYFRVNHTQPNYEKEVPVGNYTLRVIYRYPTSLYDGQRKFIISSKRTIENTVIYKSGVALLVIGILLLVLVAFIVIIYKRASNRRLF